MEISNIYLCYPLCQSPYLTSSLVTSLEHNRSTWWSFMVPTLSPAKKLSLEKQPLKRKTSLLLPLLPTVTLPVTSKSTSSSDSTIPFLFCPCQTSCSLTVAPSGLHASDQLNKDLPLTPISTHTSSEWQTLTHSSVSSFRGRSTSKIISQPLWLHSLNQHHRHARWSQIPALSMILLPSSMSDGANLRSGLRSRWREPMMQQWQLLSSLGSQAQRLVTLCWWAKRSWILPRWPACKRIYSAFY